MSSELVQARLEATVRGLVQGVGFRYATLQTAERLGLSGWVRNASDGSVEVLAEGPRPRLETLLAFLWRGPRSAAVTAVSEVWLASSGQFTGFTVRGAG